MKWFHIISSWLLPLLMGPLAKHILRDHLVQWSHFTERETEAQPEDVTGKVPSMAGKARTPDVGLCVLNYPHHPVTLSWKVSFIFSSKSIQGFPFPLLFHQEKQSVEIIRGAWAHGSSWLSWAESSAPGPQTNRPLIPLLPSSQTSLFNVPALHGKRRANSTWFLSCSKVNFWPVRFVDNWCQLLFSTSELSYPFTCSKCPHR